MKHALTGNSFEVPGAASMCDLTMAADDRHFDGDYGAIGYEYIILRDGVILGPHHKVSPGIYQYYLKESPEGQKIQAR